jgi:hypothetical protein
VNPSNPEEGSLGYPRMTSPSVWQMGAKIVGSGRIVGPKFHRAQQVSEPEGRISGAAAFYHSREQRTRIGTSLSSSSLHIRANDHIAPSSRPRPDPVMPGAGQLPTVWKNSGGLWRTSLLPCNANLVSGKLHIYKQCFKKNIMISRGSQGNPYKTSYSPRAPLFTQQYATIRS